ncbi:F0F1 ATP synthase subunit B [Thermophagus xiamenensis]|jgi:F-type H+-transporting ATPase subunit b|uniref:ATP synthase subunit b n=1 Tax=Thermophagus xiamenensis TaxID=385682 RepID=A0A1I1Z908_9BACT|nr:F0F1 ATP synthase subunit B [Thermophagus xiamenensis]SFE28175.1 ATP synthase F0 subcomplex B subunit [Thermophagus xiamenensis]
MELLTPNPGLVFWTTLTFILLLLVLRKYALPSIMRALKVREETISFALEDAKRAREEVEHLEQKKNKVLEDARKERDAILAEARELKNRIIEEAQAAAREEGRKLMEKVNADIKKQKEEALFEIRDAIGQLSLEIAEKVLKEELADREKQKKVINTYLNQMNLN